MSRPSSTCRAISGGVALTLGVLLAPGAKAAEQVDVELVLAVDVSLSMSRGSLRSSGTAMRSPAARQVLRRLPTGPWQERVT